MANAKDDKLNWIEVDVDDFSPAMKKLYKAMKDAMALVAETKPAFEKAFREAAWEANAHGEDETIILSYRFGKTTMAIVPKDSVKRKSASTVKPKFSLKTAGAPGAR